VPQTLVGEFSAISAKIIGTTAKLRICTPGLHKSPHNWRRPLGIVATAGLMGVAGPDNPTFDGDLHRSVSLRHRRDGLDRSGRFRQGPPVKWLTGGSLDAVQRRYVRMCRDDLHRAPANWIMRETITLSLVKN